MQPMKLKRTLWLSLVLILTISMTFGMHASADYPHPLLYDDSDCGCSETGSGTSESGSAGRGAYGDASQNVAADDAQPDGQAEQYQATESVNLIWLNLITLGVVSAIIVMLVHHRKAQRSTNEGTDSPAASEASQNGHMRLSASYSEASIIQSAEEIFLQLSQALRNGVIRPLASSLGKELYQRLEQQLHSGGHADAILPSAVIALQSARVIRRASAGEEASALVQINAEVMENTEFRNDGSAGTLSGNTKHAVAYLCTLAHTGDNTNWILTQVRRK